MKEVIFTGQIPQCPFCDTPTRRDYLGSSSTLMGYTKTFNEEGKDITVNPNIIKSSYRCRECTNVYTIKSRSGESEYLNLENEI